MVLAHGLTVESSSAKHTLGAIYRDESTGKLYVYAQAGSALNSGDFVTVNVSNSAAKLIDGRLVKAKHHARTTAAMTSAYYGWFELLKENGKHYAFEPFLKSPVAIQNDGTVASGVDTEVNLLDFGNDVVWEAINIATATIIVPAMAATGVNIARDLTDNDGLQIAPGLLSSNPLAFTVGTDPAFHMKVKATITDVSGTDDLVIGFRKLEAYQAAVDDYDEMFAININAGDIIKEAILNNAATDSDDTTDNWADGETHTIEVYVSAAGVCTFKIDGAAPTSAGTAFTFDTGEVVIPFIYFIHAADVAETTVIQAVEVGHD